MGKRKSCHFRFCGGSKTDVLRLVYSNWAQTSHLRLCAHLPAEPPPSTDGQVLPKRLKFCAPNRTLYQLSPRILHGLPHQCMAFPLSTLPAISQTLGSALHPFWATLSIYEKACLTQANGSQIWLMFSCPGVSPAFTD